MKSSATLSLLFLLPSIHAAALPRLVGSELESTSSMLKRDSSGKLVPRSPQPGEVLPEATISMTDDRSLDPSSNVERDISARSPQGPDSNPGEFTGFDLSRANPANHHPGGHPDPPRGREVLMAEDDMAHRHHKHNSSRHHNWSSTRHKNRTEGVLTEFNAHGEHIVVYNGTHYPNGTSYSPANTTANGGKLLGEVVVAGDEVAIYRQPWNATHHRHHNQTVKPSPTATGIWLPSGTAWIPSSTGGPRHHRKVPSPDNAGFRGPKSRKGWKVDESFSGLFKWLK